MSLEVNHGSPTYRGAVHYALNSTGHVENAGPATLRGRHRSVRSRVFDQFGKLKLNADVSRQLFYTLCEAEQARTGATTIDLNDLAKLTEAQVGGLLELGDPLALPVPSIFLRRLRELIGERGL
jgi:hypothetical protein